MFDAAVGKIFAPVLERLDGRVPPRLASFIAFNLGFVAMFLIARHFLWLGMAVFALCCGMLVVGRADERSEIYAAVNFAGLPFAFALAEPSHALAALFLLFAMTAWTVAALKFGRALIGRTLLLLVFVLIAIFPQYFGLIAYITGIACFVSAGVTVMWRAA